MQTTGTLCKRTTALFLAHTLVALHGCVHTDSIVKTWIIHDDGITTERQVSIGQTRAQAREAIGDLIEIRHDDLWIVSDQFTPFAAGLYPYYDTRSVAVYLLDDRVAAIIVRGDYNVYP